MQYAAEEPQDSAPVLAVTDDTELNFVTAQRRVAYYMFAANKNHHPNWGTPNIQARSKPPTSPPKHVVELDSFKFDYLSGDGYGFTIRIPGRKPQRSRTQDVLERARQQQPLQTFEEARSKPRRKQVTPAYAIDLTNEYAFPDMTHSLYTNHHGRYYSNESEEEPGKNIQLRRGMTGSFDSSDVLDRKRRNFARSRSELRMLVKNDDSEEVKTQSAGHRPRNERPMFEPSAPIPSYSHVSTPLANRKR